MNLACDSSYLSFLIYVRRESKSPTTFWLASTLTFRILALLANIKVEMVSPRNCLRGLIFASNLVLEFPPRESFRKKVSLESRKGMYFFFLMDSTSELITLPKQCNERLILQPSLRRSPDTLVWRWRSLPAKSTIWIFECR
jgi:hypothetical protein